LVISKPLGRLKATKGAIMRIEKTVTSISWIPSQAIKGMTKLTFDMGPAHYDDPPPDLLTDLEGLREKDGFRFANELKAYIEVEDGKIVDYGQSGKGHIGSTTLRFGGKGITIPAVALDDIRSEQVDDDKVRFVQTSGGRTGLPMPRPVKRKPFFQIQAPLAWTTLALTLGSDGSHDFEVTGASPFPRHWVYDNDGNISQKTGSIEFKKWAKEAFGHKTPWGDEDSPALVTKAESALERQLSTLIMSGKKPKREKVAEGETLVEQGDPGGHLFLLLDGVLDVEVDGEIVAEVGPGAILGEMAILQGGKRTSTLRARVPSVVVVAPPEAVDRKALEELSQSRS
jgi:hypothetical protein